MKVTIKPLPIEARFGLCSKCGAVDTQFIECKGELYCEGCSLGLLNGFILDAQGQWQVEMLPYDGKWPSCLKHFKLK